MRWNIRKIFKTKCKIVAFCEFQKKERKKKIKKAVDRNFRQDFEE